MHRALFSLPVMATLFIGLLAVIVATGRMADSKAHLADFAGASGPFEILIEMPFEPEAFHLTALQAAGRIVSVEGSHVHLRAVKRDQLHSLSWHPWIARLQAYDESKDP